MTNQEHPITPPPELAWKWSDESPEHQIADHVEWLATRAAQWGADQELEACCEYVAVTHARPYANALHAVRRPKPPSLAEKALADLDDLFDVAKRSGVFNPPDTIRRALERLHKLEGGQ